MVHHIMQVKIVQDQDFILNLKIKKGWYKYIFHKSLEILTQLKDSLI